MADVFLTRFRGYFVADAALPLSLSYAVVAFGCASCPKITCGRDGCGTEFCYHCKQLWHPNQTCDTARQQRAQASRLRGFRSSSLSYSQESGAPGSSLAHAPACQGGGAAGERLVGCPQVTTSSPAPAAPPTSSK